LLATLIALPAAPIAFVAAPIDEARPAPESNKPIILPSLVYYLFDFNNCLVYNSTT
jgi:hypothetical protein